MSIPTFPEYAERERTQLHMRLNEINRAPIQERREARAELAEALEKYMHLIPERIRWLFNGSYGWAEQELALNIINAPRMNHNAQLFTLIAALEWRTSAIHAVGCYKALSKEQQNKLNALITQEIKDYREEQAEQAKYREEELEKRLAAYDDELDAIA